MPILTIENLSKTFRSDFLVRRIEAVKNLSFDVNQGEVFGFVGHNGAGKTTTIKMLVGLTFPSEGKITLFDQPANNPAIRNRIGFLPERPYFYEYLTPREALRFYADLHGVPARKRNEKIKELLDLVGLAKHENLRMKAFSKGMLQRLGMAATLVHEPELVILDEPMSGLDPLGRADMKTIIRMLKQQGKTILFSSHILSDVEELCDRVALIAHGSLKALGTIDELTSSYGSGHVEFVVSDNLDDEKRQKLGSMGLESEAVKNGFKIMVEEERKNEVLDLLRSMEADILRLGVKHTSLEDLFVASTRRES